MAGSSNSNSFSNSGVPIFNGENFQHWSVKIMAYMRSEGLWRMVDGTAIEPPELPENPTLQQYREHDKIVSKNYKALTCLHSALSEEVFTKIVACETAAEIWNKLKEEYQGSDKTKRMEISTLKREFEFLRMKESENIQEYAGRVMAIVSKIRLLGEVVEEKRIVEKISLTLPERYESKISSLEDSGDITEIPFTEFVSALRALEQRRAMRQGEQSEGALLARKNENSGTEKKKGGWNKKKTDTDEGKVNEGRSFPPCRYCQKTTHSEKKCWSRPTIKCNGCGQMGHIKRFCKNKNQYHKGQAAESSQKQEEQLFVASCYVSGCSSEEWLVDSGCTHHMTSNSKFFRNLDRSYESRVRIGNGEQLKVAGKGDITVQTPSGTKIITDVLFVPKIDQNLLSVGQLLDKRCSVVFKNNACVIYDAAGLELFSVKMCNKNFPLNLKNVEASSYVAAMNENSLWHKRLGHYHYGALRMLQKKELVLNAPKISEEEGVCEACQYGKQVRLPFPKNQAWRASEKLELVHSDVCGPMRTPTLTGSRYFLLFIDDATRFCWVYFMKQKSEVSEHFWKWKSLVENQSDCSLKTIRSDNGSEYTAEKFNVFCREAGVDHQFSVTYTPQQNGVSERKNRTIMEMARCLLFEKKLPKKFWAEAVNTAVYLLNRLPTRALKDQTSYEAWFNKKPEVKHLKVFGCVCYSLIPEVKRGKLDEKASVGIFLGYSTVTKGYRIFNLKDEKVHVCRDVRCDEKKH